MDISNNDSRSSKKSPRIYKFIGVEDSGNNFNKSSLIRFKNDLSNLSRKVEKIDSIESSSKISTDKSKRSIRSLRSKIKSNKIPYPKNKEIKIVQIKDENSYLSGEKIEFYSGFDDIIFNKCVKCNINFNYYFCEFCLVNICEICHNGCARVNHELINLHEKLKEIDNIRFEIRKIISKTIIEPKSKNNTFDSFIEKKIVSNEIMDENEMNNDIDEAPMDYSNDLLLVENLINKKYINYFHFINIIECYNYMKNKYDKENIEKINLQPSINNEEEYIKIKYKIDKKQEITKIFGNRFVENNKDKCKIIIDDTKYNLTDYLSDLILKNHKIKNDNTFEIKLVGINDINDESYMFYYCTSLISITEISKWNTNKSINMKYMFYNCSSLISLPDISKKIISDMSYLFYQCKSLKSLPDMSDINTDLVTDMSYLFYGCSSLTLLSDISKWNTSNVTNISYIFYGCSALISLPDISKWDTTNLSNIQNIFYYCSSLKSLPDISKWNTNNINKRLNIFFECSSLESLPDISNWNTSHITDMSYLFYKCSSLISLPDISKWDTSNVVDMSNMFSFCSSLESLPDLNKWDINKVSSMNKIFNGCNLLKSLPDIFKLNKDN